MSVTLMVVAPSITWLLVRISPEEVRTIPVPAASSCWNPSVVSMSTSPGSTFWAIDETSLGPEPPVEFDPPEEFDPPAPDDPEPPEPVPELAAGVAETDGLLLDHATWPMPAPAARANTAAAAISAPTR